ncbi:NACHT domain-containing protein [Enorma massiliensis]|uniref:NACHT domain-containing protein n=1 Tax=Enorma massiliensis TaxID=1472761 RepID=A0A1Y3TZP1_9ACTN|nr:hypothetical protein [Enorma massiliensis]OUN41921.1 hypothetical protein B5G21_08720 [Enorma massiliensis]
MPDGFDQTDAQRIDVYRQAYALIEALWQPLVARGLINEKGPGPAKLSDWIKVHIGPSFPLAQDANSDRSKAYLAFHAWSEYQPGDFDDYFWGAAGSKHAGADLGEGAEPGLAQLLPKELFDKLCCMLSTTTDARIPQRPYDAQFDDPTEGLWFYGLHHFDRLADGGEPDLTDQYCQRGIGPDGQLVLRSRPFGKLVLRTSEPNRYRDRRFLMERGNVKRTRDEMLNDMRLVFLARYTDTPKRRNAPLDEEELWKAQYQNNRLRTVLEKHRLGSGSSTDDGMQTGLRAALDLAVCLPYAIVREVEKCKTRIKADELVDAILKAHASEGKGEARRDVPLFTLDERLQLADACTWPESMQDIASAITCIIVRLLLEQPQPTAYKAIISHFDYVEEGHPSALIDLKTNYLKKLAAWGDKLNMRGMRDILYDDESSYSKLYVTPEFSRNPNAWERGAGTEENDPACVIAQSKLGRVLVQAGSGMGKTTYAIGLVAGIAKWQTEHDVELFTKLVPHASATPLTECTPVLIAQSEAGRAGFGFDELKSDNGNLSDEAFAALLYRQLPHMLKEPFLSASCNDGGKALAMFQQLLRVPNSLVIIDSIDEVPLTVRYRYIEQLEHLIGPEGYNISRIIITSRPLAQACEDKLESLVHGTVMRLMPFNRTRQQALFTRLSKLFYKPNTTPIAFDRIVETPGFASLLENPFILTKLAQSLASTPQTSAFEILNKLVGLLRKLPDDPYDDPALEHIAYHMTCSHKGNSLSENDFRRRYQDCRNELNITAREDNQDPELKREGVIDRLVTRRGFLALKDERVTFEHTIIRALFASLHVLNMLPDDLRLEESRDAYDEARETYDILLNKYLSPVTDDEAFGLALLLLLSARKASNANTCEKLQTDLYGDLCSAALFSPHDESDRATQLLLASHQFDFGTACPRSKEVEMWEQRLVTLSELYTGPYEETSPS